MTHGNLYSKSWSPVPFPRMSKFDPQVLLTREILSLVSSSTRLFDILRKLSSNNISKHLEQFLIRANIVFPVELPPRKLPLIYSSIWIQEFFHRESNIPPKLHGTPLSQLQFYLYRSSQQHKSLLVYLGNNISNMACNKSPIKIAQKAVLIVSRKDNRRNGKDIIPDARLSTCHKKILVNHSPTNQSNIKATMTSTEHK